MSPERRGWPRLRTAWVMLVNGGLSLVFIAFLFDMWTESPLPQRLTIEGIQIGIVLGLIVGVGLELRHSRRAALWNVSAQLTAGVFPCAVFAFIVWRATKNGVQLDGMEAMFVLYGLSIFAASALSHLLYSRGARVAGDKSRYHL